MVWIEPRHTEAGRVPSSYACCPEKASGRPPVMMFPPGLPHSCSAHAKRAQLCVLSCLASQVASFPWQQNTSESSASDSGTPGGGHQSCSLPGGSDRHKGPQKLKASLWPQEATAGTLPTPSSRGSLCIFPQKGAFWVPTKS